MNTFNSTVLEADDVPTDSDYGSSIESETRSITSSLDNYFEQNGRRYHVYYGPEKNLMPNDDVEQERLDITHEFLRLITGGKTNQAPLNTEKPQQVLDLGTGTGIWAIDFAHENPQAEVIGLDLSPIQPNWVPPNCRFEVDDFELEWTFKQPFDFVNARTLAQSVNNWPNLLEKIKEKLNPGGWLEIGDYNFNGVKSNDDSLPKGWPVGRIANLFVEGLLKLGRLVPTGKDVQGMLEDAGFVDVQVKNFKLPLGAWPKNKELKQAGALYTIACQTGYEAYALALCTRVLGMDETETLELCKQAYESHLDRKSGVHGYIEYLTVYGRKPDIVAIEGYEASA